MFRRIGVCLCMSLRKLNRARHRAGLAPIELPKPRKRPTAAIMIIQLVAALQVLLIIMKLLGILTIGWALTLAPLPVTLSGMFMLYGTIYATLYTKHWCRRLYK